MDLTLTRNNFLRIGIFGELSFPDGTVLQTLEHAYPEDSGRYSPKIPPGTYTCKRGMHQLEHSPAPFETFEILGVPGHTNILLHIGNRNEDSAGCILLGSTLQLNMGIICASKQAFDKFMELEQGVDEFTLTVA